MTAKALGLLGFERSHRFCARRDCHMLLELIRRSCFAKTLLVRVEGLEPPRLAAPEPKSGASTNFATPAYRAADSKADFQMREENDMTRS